MRRIAYLLAIGFLVTGCGVNVQLQPFNVVPAVTPPMFGQAFGYISTDNMSIKLKGNHVVNHQGLHVTITDSSNGQVLWSQDYNLAAFVFGMTINYSQIAIAHADLEVYGWDNNNDKDTTEWLAYSHYDPKWPHSGLPGSGPV